MRQGASRLARLVLGLLLIPSAPFASAAGAVAPGRVRDIHEELAGFSGMLASRFASDEKVSERAYQIFNEGIPASRIDVHADLQGSVPQPDVKDTPASIDRMIESARKRLLDSGNVPPPEVRRALAQIDSMKGQGLIDLDKEGRLQDNEMGVYRFNLMTTELGTIRLNNFLPYIATEVGDAFAATVLFHEATHALDPNVRTEGVIEAELDPFAVIIPIMKFFDPTGWGLALVRARLTRQMRHHPSKLTSMALDFAASLDVLVGTKGDRDKIKRYAAEVGYRENPDSRRGAGSLPSA